MDKTKSGEKLMKHPMWNAKAVKAYETGKGVILVNKPYPHYEPKELPEDINPESLETIEIELEDRNFPQP